MPDISIVIPCFNHGQYIKEAIDSVEQCGNKNLYEIIIVNDGSTDKLTIDILAQLSDEGYIVINQANQGLGAARNNGIKVSRGQYILPLDSDNKIRPEYIYKSINILNANPLIAMVYGNAEYFGGENGKKVVGEFNLQKLMLGNHIDACAVYRKSVWEILGGYEEKMPVMGLEDWDFWLNMSFNNYKFCYVDNVLYDYRVLENSMLRSIDGSKKEIITKFMNEKYKDYFNINYINLVILNSFKKNKILILKLLLALYFPSVLRYLRIKKKIANENVFI